MGGFAGVAIGQAAIPVPLVGAVVGGVVGAACGGLHADSFARGMLRLSGNKAKGGDDLVRCVEHHTSDNLFPPAAEPVRWNRNPPAEYPAPEKLQAKHAPSKSTINDGCSE